MITKQKLKTVVRWGCLLAVMTGPTHAADWAELSGEETLREFVSDAKVERR